MSGFKPQMFVYCPAEESSAAHPLIVKNHDEWGTVGSDQSLSYDVRMPYGLHRYQQAATLHFLTFSCFHRLPFLSHPEPKYLVESLLEQTRSRHQARIYAYVLMPEHVHILINEPPSILLDQWIKSFKQSTSRKLKGTRKQFWQTRYFDKNITGEDARSEIVRYIHRNPVKRGLVIHPADYPWSSFLHYTTGTRGKVEIESDWTARRRETHSLE